ncbi:MAG: RelA/SpoT family protein [Patescibacteria group bacterium]
MENDRKFKQLLQKTRDCCPTENMDEIRRVYEFARVAFGDRKRASGKSQLDHALDVAILLIDWKMPPDIVIAGLLHDILEYTTYTEEDIAKKFGRKVARLIIGENRLDSLKYMGKERYAENLRRMFLAMADDVQVVFIKFADRVDNLRTLAGLPEEKKRRLALESLNIYAPIAGRLGMDLIRRELEDLSFKNLMPKEYGKISELVESYKKHERKNYEQVKQKIEDGAKTNGIKITAIENRIKSMYSLYRKAEAKKKNPTKIYDIAACRVIVPTVADCYTLLGIIHANWHPLPDRFKDFIAQPKPNGYRSLHTNVFCNKTIVEFQIRTIEMHQEAEYGVTAHWIYKEQRDQWQKDFVKRTAWIKELFSIQKEIKNHADFSNTIKSVKLDLFKNRIFVLTPKGDVIDLPDDATPLDYAYEIHVEIGHHYLSAKVNGEIVPMNHILHSNDAVEIIRSHDQPTVKNSWLRVVATRHAREEIKNFLSKHADDE